MDLGQSIKLCWWWWWWWLWRNWWFAYLCIFGYFQLYFATTNALCWCLLLGWVGSGQECLHQLWVGLGLQTDGLGWVIENGPTTMSVWYCHVTASYHFNHCTLHLKRSHLMFDNNFGKCRSIFDIFSPSDLWENSLCTHYKDFYLTCNMLLHYLVKFKNPKMLPNFHIERDDV